MRIRFCIVVCVLAALTLVGCDAELDVKSNNTGVSGDMGEQARDMGGAGDGAGSVEDMMISCPDEDLGADMAQPDDVLDVSRRLRRASLVLRDHPPSVEEYEALEAAADAEAYLASFVERELASPVFYRKMFEVGRAWFNVPLIPRTADAPEYGMIQQRVLIPCAEGSFHEGALHYNRENFGDGGACDDVTAPKRALEPWWAPGQEVTLVGSAARTEPKGVSRKVGNLVEIDCAEEAPAGTCGCDVAAVRCYPDYRRYPGWGEFLPYSGDGHRRMMSEEAARLFAHIVWHDKPATDLVLGDYLVGPTKVQAAYVVQALRGGRLELLQDSSWWSPAQFNGAPVDPEHAADDPLAWREYKQHERNPFLLAQRDYKYDPRVQTEPVEGIPSAGMLTSMGVLAAWPRERLRAARLLEVLGCEVFSPPSADQEFNVYREDPATEGGCQHCHRRLDPAAIHFKRFAKAGSASEGWGASYYMPGVGSRWHWSDAWLKGQYPYHGEPFSHWNRWYTAGTKMTPVTPEQVQANNEAVFIDFLPPDQTLLGQVSDGTIGPLGFGKLLVQSGAFDRCMVRQVHKVVLGRDIDPAAESGYLELWVSRFVAADRSVRSLIKAMIKDDLFGRGI